MAPTITLSTLEFDVLWEHLRLGPFPTVLDINPHGATLDERAELTATAWESLADKDLGWPNAIDGKVAFRLRQLAHPEWELDARMHRATGAHTRALIVANTATSTLATVAVRRGDRLTLRTAPADQLARAALDLLPRHPPGTGASITLPAQTLDAAAARSGSDPRRLARALGSAGLGTSEAHRIADLAGHVIGFGHFGAARTRPHTRRRRAGHVVSVYDSTAGRYLFTRRPTGTRNWVTLIPGTDAAILRQLDELLGELA